MSEVQLSQERTHARVSFLAYDILRGLYHYRVSIQLPPPDGPDVLAAESAPPQMTVRLLAIHRLAQLYSLGGSGASEAPRGRSGFTPGSRGFVSACVLGRTGRRGVWIERRRGSMRRSVIAFSEADDVEEERGDWGGEGVENQGVDVDWMKLRLSEDDTGGEDVGSETAIVREDRCAKPIDGRVLFEVNSYDLRGTFSASDVNVYLTAETVRRRHNTLRVRGVDGHCDPRQPQGRPEATLNITSARNHRRPA